MSERFKPQKEADVERIVSWAGSQRKPIEILGGGSKRVVGRPFNADYVLDMSYLTGITLYEPEELVLCARAGTSIPDITEALAAESQELAFEPPDFTEFLGSAIGSTTLGGALGSNYSGPRRIRAGAVRDHVLGMRAVTGRAELVNFGGRVMKNVTGYDVSRGLAGSWGTLAVMTEITVKVLPRAETQATLVVIGLSTDQAVLAMSAALGSTAEVSAACHIPAPLAARSFVAAISSAGRSITAFRIEGILSSVVARRQTLVDELKEYGEIGVLSVADSVILWIELRDVKLFEKTEEFVIWRISTAPTRAPDIVRNLSVGEDFEALYDWGGGLVWLQQPASGDGGGEAIRAELARAGGHATLMRASPATRTAAKVFEPQPEALASLSRRIKAVFDPHAILNPGRMYPGV